MANKIALLLVLIMLGACSGLQKPLQPEAKVNADNMLQYARRLENKGSPTAIRAFEQAFGKYRAMADIEGELWSLAGIARLHSSQGDSLSSKDALDSMQNIIRDIDPTLEYTLVLTRMQMLAGKNNWDAVLTQVKVDSSYPLLVRMQILSFGVQAGSYLNKPDAIMANELQRLYERNRKKSHKKGSEQALGIANAAYSLACYHYVLGDMDKAARLVTSATELDYLYGNFRGLGYDHWLMGRIHASGKDLQLSRSEYLKAQRIFETITDSKMLMVIQTELQSLYKGDGE